MVIDLRYLFQRFDCIDDGREHQLKYSIPGLGSRLRRARDETGLSQEAVAERIGVSWLTVHRWERSQRMIPDRFLDRLCDLYGKPIRWFLTLEDGDLNEEIGPFGKATGPSDSAAAGQLSRLIADAPSSHRAMIERVVEDILDGLRRSR